MTLLRIGAAIGFLACIGSVTEGAPKLRKAAAPPTYSFQKIVDTTTSIPGGSGTFSGFYRPVIQGGQVAFRAYSQGAPDYPVGVYRRALNGALQVIADKSSHPPGGPNFISFGEPVISQGEVVFGGGFNQSDPYTYTGIYRGAGGPVTTLVDRTTIVPGAVSEFTSFFSYAYKSGDLAFIAEGLNDDDLAAEGLYHQAAGSISVVADTVTTPVPGLPNATFWLFQSNPAFYGSLIAFSADNDFQTSPKSGVFLADGAALSSVINTAYSFYRDLSASPQRLAFCVYDSAIYQLKNGQLTQPVTAYTTPLPDLPLLPVNTIGSAAVSGDALAFHAGFQITFSIPFPEFPLIINVPIHFGIYADFGSGWEKVVAQGDVIDGQRVRGITFGPNGFDGQQLTFRLDLESGHQAIYVATRQ